MTQRNLFITALLLGCLAVGLAVRGRESRPADPPPTKAPVRALRAEGRVTTYPGDDVIVGADLASGDLGGTLCQVLVQEGDAVRKGQLLAVIDERQEAAALDEAQSKVRELAADLRFQETELGRAETLQASGITSRQSLDQARTQLALSRARHEAAQATARRLQVNLAKARIVSPLEGRVVARFAEPGTAITPGLRLFEIAQTQRLRVEAEIDEFDLEGLRLGQSVRVRADGFETSWKGLVEEIPAQVVGRRLKPQDPARPSDTRVLLVKVALLAATPLKLGQRVELEIEP